MAESKGYERLSNVDIDEDEARQTAAQDYGSTEDSPTEVKKQSRLAEYIKNKCGYPLQVYFILGNEFCERFSYYGMRAVLVIYLTTMLKMQNDTATEIYHAFNMLCYFSPIIGAIIADSFWGKYKTILYISLVYALGNITVAVTSIPKVLFAVQMAGPAVGLLLIAIGTGGIKPCVSAFGGDQFEQGQEEKLKTFFSIFYFAINFGSLLSTLLTPIFRSDVQCFGYGCYPLAFGIPAVLMIVSIFIFVMGTPLYKRNPPEGNVVVKVTQAVGHALKRKIKNCGRGEKKSHWMDWADDHYDRTLISDIKALFKVLFMFLPLPAFWTLFDQQGSRWTLQAMEMNGDIGALGTLKPDQLQALNPVFVMILIPFFETIVYPLADKCKLLRKPLQRMSVGMFLTALSFVIAGILQTTMEKSSSVAQMPATGFANLRVINAIPCSISVSSAKLKQKEINLKSKMGTEYFAVPTKLSSLDIKTVNCPQTLDLNFNVKIVQHFTYTLIIGLNHSSITPIQMQDQVTPLSKMRAYVRFVHVGGNVRDEITVSVNKSTHFDLTPLNDYDYHKFNSKSYSIKVLARGTQKELANKNLKFSSGGIYTVVIQSNANKDKLVILNYADVSPRPISILWQIPQYIIITSGEVLFSITGLEFAYSQSPPSMKSCIMAAWLLTVSFGNLLVVILAGARLTEDMATEFFFFAAFLAVVSTIFSVMAYFYKYVYYGSSREEVTEEILEDDEIPLTNRDDIDEDNNEEAKKDEVEEKKE
eukprot:gene17454-19200_t